MTLINKLMITIKKKNNVYICIYYIKYYCGGFQEKVLDSITWCHKIENMT
jgi:hypothetical protein